MFQSSKAALKAAFFITQIKKFPFAQITHICEIHNLSFVFTNLLAVNLQNFILSKLKYSCHEKLN